MDIFILLQTGDSSRRDEKDNDDDNSNNDRHTFVQIHFGIIFQINCRTSNEWIYYFLSRNTTS